MYKNTVKNVHSKPYKRSTFSPFTRKQIGLKQNKLPQRTVEPEMSVENTRKCSTDNQEVFQEWNIKRGRKKSDVVSKIFHFQLFPKNYFTTFFRLKRIEGVLFEFLVKRIYRVFHLGRATPYNSYSIAIDKMSSNTLNADIFRSIFKA